VEQELLTLPEHLSSLPVYSGVCVIRSLVLCVCFVDRCLSFCTFSFGHCVVCSSSIYGFWLPLWYLQTSSSYCVTSTLHGLTNRRKTYKNDFVCVNKYMKYLKIKWVIFFSIDSILHKRVPFLFPQILPICPVKFVFGKVFLLFYWYEINSINVFDTVCLLHVFPTYIFLLQSSQNIPYITFTEFKINIILKWYWIHRTIRLTNQD
jgi:hypothetical protein